MTVPQQATTRYQAISDWLTAEGRVDVVDIANRLGVAQETIRRDLRTMETAGKLQRVHGGAVRIDAGPLAIRNSNDAPEGDDLELSLPGSAARRGPGAGNKLTAVPEDQHACRQPRSSAARGASLDHCAGAAGASAWRGRCSSTLSSERSCSRMNSSAR